MTKEWSESATLNFLQCCKLLDAGVKSYINYSVYSAAASNTPEVVLHRSAQLAGLWHRQASKVRIQ
jgi:hypothetical protein